MQETKQDENPKLVGEASTFEVELDTTQHGVGLGIDLRAGTLMVVRVNPGAVQQYNECVEAACQVRVHDFIVGANAVTAPEAMVKELSKKGRLQLKVHRAAAFKVVLNKGGRPLGMKLAFVASSNNIGIAGIVDAATAVAKYNKIAPPDSQIKVGDRIMSVSGVEGSPKKMVEAMEAGETLELTIAGVSP